MRWKLTDKPIAAGKSSYDRLDAATLWQALDLGEDTVLMDLGCGVGNYAVAAAGRIGPRGLVHAIDAWAEGIAQLETRIAREGIANIRPAVADVSREIPVLPGSVDVCLMATVVHDLIQDRRFEDAMSRVVEILAGRGRLAVVEFKKIDGPPGPPIHIRLSPEELAAAVAPFGFSRPQVTGVGTYHYLALFEPAA